MTYPLKIVYFGTPNPAMEVLDALIESKHEIVAVITQPDKRRGRGKKLMPTPVKQRALEAGIECHEPSNKAELSEMILGLKADVGVVVAYGRILPLPLLDHFKFGCINVHYSLLPKYRGAAPVERAILDGEKVTGVSIMKMDEGLDTGDVFVSRQIDIENKTTTSSLFKSLNAVACDLLLVVLDHLETQAPIAQVGEPSYAHKLSAEDFYFDSDTSCADLDLKVRAGSMVKGAWTHYGGERLRLLLISPTCESSNESLKQGHINKFGDLSLKDGSCTIKEIQAPGKSVMDFASWANGIGLQNFPIRIDK